MIQSCGDYGSFEYKAPNIADYLEMLGAAGLDSSDMTGEAEQSNDLVLAAKMLRACKPLVGKVDVKVGKKKLKDYDDLLSELKLMAYMLEFNASVQQGFAESDSKKK